MRWLLGALIALPFILLDIVWIALHARDGYHIGKDMKKLHPYTVSWGEWDKKPWD